MPRFGPLQKTPIESMRAVVQPSPFRGWAMDVVSKIYQPHLKDNFILVPIDYFMKWVKVEPLVSVTQKL